MADFELAFKFMLPHEGGFQRHVNDRGNWTGGKVGEGELRGTKFGISAASYPDLDIESLTIDQAHDIYLRDWWNTHRWCELKSQAVASKVFDLCVNMGPEQGCKVVQRALIDCGHPVVVDGKFGYLTIQASNATQDCELLEAISQRAEERYRDIARANPATQEYLADWVLRAREVPA